jgi:hypothetical protein
METTYLMNLPQILKEMRDERDLLNQAILCFERLAANIPQEARAAAGMVERAEGE